MRLITGVNFFTKLWNKIEKQFTFQTKIKWRVTIQIFAYHAVGLYWSYLYAFPVKWQTVVFAMFMYVVSQNGISCSVHRYWSHRTFKATLPLKIYLALAFACTAQNSIYKWVRDHRLHHKFSDTEADPHNINRGFFFSHIGWLMLEKNQFVKEKGKQIDMSDILQDPVARFDKKYSRFLGLIFGFFLPTIAAVVLWQEKWQCAAAWQCFIRFLLVFHAEMCVNSFAHTYGDRPFNRNIKATRNGLVSLVCMGEGSHNYHHVFPVDYKSSEIFDFINLSTFMIKLWARLGLAYDLKEPSPQLVQAVLERQQRKRAESS